MNHIEISLPQYIADIQELHKVMETLPMLRPIQENIESDTAVVCHVSDFSEALIYYKEITENLPSFYVEGITEISVPSDVCVYDFTNLTSDLSIQLYFKQANAPVRSHFGDLALKLRSKGCTQYSLAAHSAEKLYCRNRQQQLSEDEFTTILAFYNKLEDQASKHTYLGVCKARQKADAGYIPMAPYAQYWHPVVHAEKGEYFCEGGPEDGVTTKDFAQAVGKEGIVFSFEPVPKNYSKASEFLKSYNNICLEEKALWSATEEIGLDINDNSFNSVFSVNNKEDAVQMCQAVSIDDYFAQKRLPDCIKLDVEGVEIPVLNGARKTILTHRPKIIAAIYHRKNGHDFLNVPKLLMEMLENYTFYVGQHYPWYGETILYAMPQKLCK